MAYVIEDRVSRAEVEARVARGLDVNARSIFGDTLLMQAVDVQDVALIIFLLENGAQVYGESSEADRPLLRAIDLGRTDIVEILLEHGANVRVFENSPKQIHDLLISGEDDIVRLLLNHGLCPNIRFESQSHSESMLIMAVRQRKSELIDVLLNCNAAINSTDRFQRTSLFYAIVNSDPLLVKKLLLYKADPNLFDSDGNSPLALALEKGDEEMVIGLLQNGANLDRIESPEIHGNALQRVLARNQISMYKLLMRFKPNVNFVNRQRLTVLDTLVRCTYDNYFYMAEFAKLFDELVEAGADVEKMKGYPYIPEKVYRYASRDIIETLIRHKLQIQRSFIHDKSSPPLHQAMYNFDKDILKYLIEVHKVDIETRDYWGNTAFLKAAEDYQLSKMEWLYALGANIQQRNYNLVSALQLTSGLGFDVSCSFRWLLKNMTLNDTFDVLYDVTLEEKQNYVRYIVRHISLKTRGVGVHVIEDAMVIYISPGNVPYLHACIAEIQKSLNDGINSHTFFEILYVTRFNPMAKDDRVLKELKTYSKLTEYPIYWSYMIKNYKRANRYQRLIQNALVGLHKILLLDCDTFQFIYKSIYSHLTEDELRVLSNV